MKQRAVVCLAVAVLAMGAILAQQLAPIRVDVSLVNVGFSVRDESGRLVTSLTQDDVEITEDGVAQKIAFFARSTDVSLNLGLVMDVSGSQQSFIKPHMKDLQAFLKNVLRPQDKAYLMTFANRLMLVSDYTASPKELVNALDDFQHDKQHRQEYPSVGPPEFRVLGTAFYDAIFYGSTLMMRNIDRGRRALIVFSDGEDNSSAHHMLEVIEAAQANDVLLFTIRYTEMRMGRLNARNKYGIGVMERLALETGGGAFDGQGKGLVESFKQIGEQLRSSYELGYHTSNPPGDKTFHKITIKARQPGLVVRAKTGYYAR